eukprot:s5662_g1.t1
MLVDRLRESRKFAASTSLKAMAEMELTLLGSTVLDEDVEGAVCCALCGRAWPEQLFCPRPAPTRASSEASAAAELLPTCSKPGGQVQQQEPLQPLLPWPLPALCLPCDQLVRRRQAPKELLRGHAVLLRGTTAALQAAAAGLSGDEEFQPVLSQKLVHLGEGAQASSGPLAGEAASLPEELAEPSVAEDFLAVATPEELEALRLGPYCRLARGLGTVGSWTPRARIARAYRAGVSAGFRLRGDREYIVSSPALPLRNRLYVVLRCDARPQGFFTDRFRTFEENVRRDRCGALSQAEIVRLIADAPEGRPLPLVYLVDDEATPTMRITAFLLKHRGGGFMIAVPNTQVVHDLVSGFATEAGDNPLCFTELDVACETPRHRLVGDVSLLFADVPWSWLGFFRKGSALRASSLTLVSVVSGTSVVRPLVSAALAAADAWINSAIAEPDLQESMGEYATAVEVEGEAEDAEPEEEDDAAPNAELARLRAQVAALERAAQTQPPPAGGGLRGLGGWCSRPVPGGWWCQSFGRRPVLLADGLLAELDAEANQDEVPVTGADPLLQRLLVIQTRMLSQLTATRPQGPLETALASGGAKEDGNLNARGSAARDAYVKLLRDNVQVASQIRRLVAEDVGESIEDPPNSLMRRYIERRCPLGEHRTLGLVATFAAQAWQAARESGNLELEAWMARLILFVDQAGTENGKTQLAWLLTGLPEPSWSTMMRKKSGLKPFAKSCPSLWASANLAYLREMDWLSSRMSSAAGSGQGKDQGKEGDAVDESAPSDRPPRRPRRPKGGQSSTT